jgi:dihydroxy-acid dehydratase
MDLQHTIAVVTDGRYSGASKGLAVGHVCPEAMDGGLIAYVKDGDKIRIDIPGRKIDLLISDDEIKLRQVDMPLPEVKPGNDILSFYSSLVGPASEGAVLQGEKRVR